MFWLQTFFKESVDIPLIQIGLQFQSKTGLDEVTVVLVSLCKLMTMLDGSEGEVHVFQVDILSVHPFHEFHEFEDMFKFDVRFLGVSVCTHQELEEQFHRIQQFLDFLEEFRVYSRNRECHSQ